MLWESRSGKVAAAEGSSKYWVILRLDQKNVFSKFGVLAIIDLEISKLKEQLKMTSVEGLISWELQQLRHPNFEWQA